MFVHYTPGSLERAEAFLTDFFSPDESQWFDYSPYAAYPHLCPYWYSPAFSTRVYYPQGSTMGKIPFGKGPPPRHRVASTIHARGVESRSTVKPNIDRRRLLGYVPADDQDVDVDAVSRKRVDLIKYPRGRSAPARPLSERHRVTHHTTPRTRPVLRRYIHQRPVSTRADDAKGMGRAKLSQMDVASWNVDDDTQVEVDNDVAMGRAFVWPTDGDEDHLANLVDNLINPKHHDVYHPVRDIYHANRKGQAHYQPGKTFGVGQHVYVGRIETFNKSLTALGRIANVTIPEPNASKKHEAGLDMVARLEKNAMLAFLERSPQWTARLAERYRPDICLFGYNTTPCHNMTRFASIVNKLIFL